MCLTIARSDAHQLAETKEPPTLEELLLEQGYATLLRGANPLARFGLEADWIDVLPTLCRLLDSPVPPMVQGRCSPFAGRATPRSHLSKSIAYGRERVALTTPDGWKLVPPFSVEKRPQLFVLPDDPGE